MAVRANLKPFETKPKPKLALDMLPENFGPACGVPQVPGHIHIQPATRSVSQPGEADRDPDADISTSFFAGPHVSANIFEIACAKSQRVAQTNTRACARMRVFIPYYKSWYEIQSPESLSGNNENAGLGEQATTLGN